MVFSQTSNMGPEELTVGLDLGNGRVKVWTINGSNRPVKISFYSAIGESRGLLQANRKVDTLGANTHTLEFKHGHRTVGDFASIQSKINLGNMHEYRFSDSHLVLALALTGLGLVAEKTGHTVFNLVTGLPLTHFQAQHDAVQRTLAGEHQFVLDGKHYKIHCNVSTLGVVLCTFGPWSDFTGIGPEMTIEKVVPKLGFIDIGTGTTDFTQIVNGDDPTYVQEKSGSIPLGWSTVTAYVAKLLSASGIDIDHIEIDMAIRGQHGIGSVSIEKWTDEAVAIVGKAIADHAMQIWGPGRDINNIVVTGGPADMFLPVLKQEYPHPSFTLLKDPMFATARGYHAWGKYYAYA